MKTFFDRNIVRAVVLACALGMGALGHANETEDDKFWAVTNGLASIPCEAGELQSDTACGQAVIQSDETLVLDDNSIRQHRSVGLMQNVGKFSFAANIVVRDEMKTEARRNAYKVVKYVGTCRGYGKATGYDLLLLSTAVVGEDGVLVKRYGYAPGGISAIASVKDSQEGSLLRKICSEFRAGTRMHPTVVY